MKKKNTIKIVFLYCYYYLKKLIIINFIVLLFKKKINYICCFIYMFTLYLYSIIETLL